MVSARSANASTVPQPGVAMAVTSRLYRVSGRVVSYVSRLMHGRMDAGHDSGVLSAPIWIGLQSAVVGAFETIVAVAGGFAITVGEAVVCAVARFSQRHRFFLAFLDMASTSACVELPRLVSQAITAALNTLSISSISGGNGIPSFLGQSCWSQ
jgi:hypothetical protein